MGIFLVFELVAVLDISVRARSDLGRRPCLLEKIAYLGGGAPVCPKKLPENRFFITQIFGVLPE